MLAVKNIAGAAASGGVSAQQPRTGATPFRRVILASDGSENSLRAAAYAGKLVSGYKDVQVIIVYVSGLPDRRQTRELAGFTYEVDVSLDELLNCNADPVFTRTADALGPIAGKIKTQVLIGRPAEQIADLARSMRSDLIICGRRGLSGLKEFFVGSTSDRLLHAAPCPVLIVQ